MSESLKVEEPKQQQQQVTPEIPKSKEDWTKLSKEDPDRWKDLTQERMDQTIRESRETRERLLAAEQREKNLQVELEQFKKKQAPPPQQQQDQRIYGNGVYPSTKEEWNDLALEDPVFFQDLRFEFLNQKNTAKQDFETTRQKSIESLVSEHADMYHLETETDGRLKLGENGKPVVKKDPVTGGYAFNENSEKGKLWAQIYQEDPQGWNTLRDAPKLMMAEMERRLRIKGAEAVKNGQNDEQDQSGLAPQGVPPPKAVNVKFVSEEEKAHAERAVSRGVYKSLEEYVSLRDGKPMTYQEKNSFPDFSKKVN